MKRDWKIVRSVLEVTEQGNLHDFVSQNHYTTELEISKELFLGHVEILLEANVLSGGYIKRGLGGFSDWDLRRVHITMQGHDLLDALRDDNVWVKIQAKAARLGVALSWEFIKTAFPVVIKELLQ